MLFYRDSLSGNAALAVFPQLNYSVDPAANADSVADVDDADVDAVAAGTAARAAIAKTVTTIAASNTFADHSIHKEKLRFDRNFDFSLKNLLNLPMFKRKLKLFPILDIAADNDNDDAAATAATAATVATAATAALTATCQLPCRRASEWQKSCPLCSSRCLSTG